MIRLLDLFCGAGGAAMGYHRASFEVVGVDINPQPRYPFDFIRGDALATLYRLVGTGRIAGFHAIHASPPCQGYSVSNNVAQRSDHPLLIAEVRDLLEQIGLPYVIENVEGARCHMRNPVTICGLALGLNVKRHRLFECSFPVMVPPCTGHERDYLVVVGTGAAKARKRNGRKAAVPHEDASAAMGIDWMRRPELSEAIPPAYTEHIGHYLKAALEVPCAA